ncbi:MAG: CoA transferase subunit A [Candidatus Hodarchaeota archaeon]
MTIISNLSDIVSEVILPQTKIAIGGGAMFLKPMEVVREIIRQQIKDLEIITLIGDIDIDLLCGVGAIKKVQSSYVGLPMIGMALNFRKSIEKGTGLVYSEWSELSMIRAFQAGALGIPVVAVRSLLGSDLVKIRSDFQEVVIHGKKYIQVPALNPDLAIVHAYAGDQNGNIFYPTQHVLDDFSLLPARCSKVLFVTVEKIISNQEGREIVEQGHLPMFSYLEVDFIAEAARGAWPTGFPPVYAGDMGHLMTYSGMSRDSDTFQIYLKENVLNEEL